MWSQHKVRWQAHIEPGTESDGDGKVSKWSTHCDSTQSYRNNSPHTVSVYHSTQLLYIPLDYPKTPHPTYVLKFFSPQRLRTVPVQCILRRPAKAKRKPKMMHHYRLNNQQDRWKNMIQNHKKQIECDSYYVSPKGPLDQLEL